MTPRTYLTRREASEYTGFSEQTLGKWAATGKGPRFTKIGTGRPARVRYAIADLEAFLRGETARSPAAREPALLERPPYRASVRDGANGGKSVQLVLAEGAGPGSGALK
jgi:hypothetical protein